MDLHSNVFVHSSRSIIFALFAATNFLHISIHQPSHFVGIYLLSFSVADLQINKKLYGIQTTILKKITFGTALRRISLYCSLLTFLRA